VTAAAALLLATTAAAAERCPRERWPLWESYAARFIQADGRVVDLTGGGKSTSEGQAYALLHALVADDRARFEAVLRWARENLAGGDLAKRLPAWLWGRAKDGKSGVLDRNAASDADVWMAYALLEAGRLWERPDLRDEGRALLALVAEREVADLPGLGLTLLPGPRGFEVDEGVAWRLNPSYLALQPLRRFAVADPKGPWEAVVRSANRVLLGSARQGVAPDWALYEGGRFRHDDKSRAVASYDAIRVPLWIGLLDEGEPLRKDLAAALGGLLGDVSGRGGVAEKVQTRTGARSTTNGPPGFLAALLPMALLMADAEAAAVLSGRLADALWEGLYGDPPAYYDQNLILFGQGFAERRYRFAADGSLMPRWSVPCAR
jgi:endoglucanase